MATVGSRGVFTRDYCLTAFGFYRLGNVCMVCGHECFADVRMLVGCAPSVDHHWQPSDVCKRFSGEADCAHASRDDGGDVHGVKVYLTSHIRLASAARGRNA